MKKKLANFYIVGISWAILFSACDPNKNDTPTLPLTTIDSLAGSWQAVDLLANGQREADSIIQAHSFYFAKCDLSQVTDSCDGVSYFRGQHPFKYRIEKNGSLLVMHRGCCTTLMDLSFYSAVKAKLHYIGGTTHFEVIMEKK